MTVLLAVVAVGLGSAVFRLAPLLGARRLPERLSRVASVAGLGVLTAVTVRAVVLHDDPSVPWAPVLAAVSVAAGLLLARRGRPVLVSVAVGATSYLLLSAALAALD